MAESKRRLFAAFRFSRKLVLIAGGALVTLGASGTAALVMTGPSGLIPGFSAEDAGGHCKTIYQTKFRRIDEVRIVAVIQTDDKEPARRAETGMRLARHIAETEHPDLVTVQLTDIRGPTERTRLRGAAIGTEIVHAPNPNKTRATKKAWEVRYIDAPASELGLFFGPRIEMSQVDMDLAATKIPVVEGCDGDIVEEVAEAKGGHGEAKPASGGH
jgi:hypothetical protein